MEIITKLSWAALALIHLMPALVSFAPRLTERLYGVPSDGPISLLLTHRGALFAAVVLVAVLALVDPNARRAASLVTGVSVISFLVLYALSGAPAGSLRTIAIVDLFALAPLAFVLREAWLR
jgi:hypothetical protein